MKRVQSAIQNRKSKTKNASIPTEGREALLVVPPCFALALMLPLPLGEGWGEGLSAIKREPSFAPPGNGGGGRRTYLECGVWNSECGSLIPHSSFRVPHYVLFAAHRAILRCSTRAAFTGVLRSLCVSANAYSSWSRPLCCEDSTTRVNRLAKHPSTACGIGVCTSPAILSRTAFRMLKP